MRNIRFILLICSFVFTISCSKKTNEDIIDEVFTESSDWLGTTQQEYNGPQIVRLAWGIFPKEHISEERFREMADAGITHCTDWRDYNFNICEDLLNYGHDTGVKVILNCSNTATDTESVIEKFKDHPALDGYYLDDEPDSREFTRLGEIASRLQSADPEKYCYVNLYRIDYNDSQFGKGTENYRKYLNYFISELNPKFISYDNYTIYYDSQGKLQVDSLMFENLEVVRDVALNAGIDFWAFCNTTKHTVSKRSYPDPLLGYIRFYVYSNLAYGAQGIEYFTYWQAKPSDEPNAMGHYFLSAPILYEGKKSQIYGRLRTVNTEIENLSFVFADAEVRWIRHTGNKIPKGTIRLNDELEGTPIRLPGPSDGLILSLLEKGNLNYLVIVNRDPFKTKDLSIETQPGVKRVLKSGASIDPEKKLKILEGDAVIYSWE